MLFFIGVLALFELTLLSLAAPTTIYTGEQLFHMAEETTNKFSIGAQTIRPP